jgi:hypothetical protein
MGYSVLSVLSLTFIFLLNVGAYPDSLLCSTTLEVGGIKVMVMNLGGFDTTHTHKFIPPGAEKGVLYLKLHDTLNYTAEFFSCVFDLLCFVSINF